MFVGFISYDSIDYTQDISEETILEIGLSILITILIILVVLLPLPLFILSIIHLTKYEEKGFAITVLVLTSLFFVFAIIGSIFQFTLQYDYFINYEEYGYESEREFYESYIDLERKCESHCLKEHSNNFYYLYYDYYLDRCECMDSQMYVLSEHQNFR